jgi:hypothetical protein
VLTEHVSQSRAVATILLYNIVSFSVELLIVAAAAPLVALLLPVSPAWRDLIILTGIACAVISLGLYLLVQRGMLASVARPFVSKARFARWEPRLRGIDEKMQLVMGARRRDRLVGIAAVIASRLSSMVLSLLILHAVGEPITISFVAAWTIGSFIIYVASTLVPMGLGISESGYYGFYRALGENPARGVTLVLARRTVTIMYAMIGLVLVASSETVQRARESGTAAALVQAVPVAIALATDDRRAP